MYFKIEGVDFSELVDESDFTIDYVKREGNLGGIMLDGSMTVDVRAIKAVLQVKLTAATATEMYNVLQKVLSRYVKVGYFDMYQNQIVDNVDFIPTINGIPFAFVQNNTYFFKEGSTLTLEER